MVANNNEKTTNERQDFTKTPSVLELPTLVSVQTNSFKNFIDNEVEKVFLDTYPIKSNNGEYELTYVSHTFKEAERTPDECKKLNRSYERTLIAHFNLLNNTTGVTTNDDVFLGDYPWMTDTGTFIIKGVERGIVSQLVRAPGAYYSIERNKEGKMVYGCDLIPHRGTWLQFETDQKGIIWARIDRNKKVLSTVLFRALGFTDKNEFCKLFMSTREKENSQLDLTIKKDTDWKDDESREALIISAQKDIYNKLKPGEPYNVVGASKALYAKFFDPKKYDLCSAGRYKFNKKLGMYNQIINQYIAEDIEVLDETGEKVLKTFVKGTKITKKDVEFLQEHKYFENYNIRQLKNVNKEIDVCDKVNIVEVYTDETRSSKVNLIGTDLNLDTLRLTIPDVVSAFSYYVNYLITNNSHQHIGTLDDIDHLSNRRIKTVGELLQNEFRKGIIRMQKQILGKMSTDGSNKEISQQDLIKKFTNTRPLVGAISNFFSSSQLSSFLEQTNPLAQLTNLRRLSALGPGGLSRERAGVEVRDVHYSHYGRICPIETPEGPNIGLINNLCCYARVNDLGFLETPYRKVNKISDDVIEVTDEVEFLDAAKEYDKYIGQASIELTEKDGKYYIANKDVVARYRGDAILTDRNEIDYIDVSPKQIVSVATACIPFLENDDGKRALMGANMQRQAIPLLKPHAPCVGTGMERKIAHDSGFAVLAKEDGVVTFVDSKRIEVTSGKKVEKYYLQKFVRSNQGTCINQNAIVKVGQKVKKDEIIADGPAMENGELALGQNVTVAFMTWDGYNFEDAVILSDRLVKDDVYTSIHIEEIDVDCRETKNGPEEISRDLPQVSAESKAFLDARGIVVPGATVKEGDILVGKLTPKGSVSEERDIKILRSIWGEKSSDKRNTSRYVLHGGDGIVVDVKVLTREDGAELAPGVIETIKVFVAQKRKISEGDKMAGRHGNKGVISKIVPMEDMPYLADGTPIDIMLNPLGVPSRMNIGQVLEFHLGYAASKLGMKVATPVFDGCSKEEIMELMEKAGVDEDGKTTVYDGRTGEPLDERISVGTMYMIKLAHMVDDKLHARASGNSHSMVTQQPLGGKAQNGGQRFGEMEVWALEAYGAAHTLQEILTIKSDDIIGRDITLTAIREGRPIPDSGIPEAFKVLVKEMQGLGINVEILDSEGKVQDKEKLDISSEMKERSFDYTNTSFSSVYSSYEEEEEDEETNTTIIEDSYDDDDYE